MKEILKIIYKKQKDKGFFSYNKGKTLITIKPRLKRELEAEVLMHEFIHFLEQRYMGKGKQKWIIGNISEQRTMKLGKWFMRILKRRIK